MNTKPVTHPAAGLMTNLTLNLTTEESNLLAHVLQAAIQSSDFNDYEKDLAKMLGDVYNQQYQLVEAGTVEANEVTVNTFV